MSNVVTQLTSLPIQSGAERYATTHITAVWGIALMLATRCKRSFRGVASQGEAIFHHDAERQEFLRTLGQACLKTGWQVHAYCLMNNHFHLVMVVPERR